MSSNKLRITVSEITCYELIAAYDFLVEEWRKNHYGFLRDIVGIDVLDASLDEVIKALHAFWKSLPEGKDQFLGRCTFDLDCLLIKLFPDYDYESDSALRLRG